MLNGILNKSREIIGKGTDFVSKSVTSVKEAAIEKKNKFDTFNQLVTMSNHIGPMHSYSEFNTSPSEGREEMILKLGLSINLVEAGLIDKLIPCSETIIDIKRSKETKTEIEYIFICTNRQLWVMNKNEYRCYDYENIAIAQIVNPSIMSQNVNFENMAFTIDGSENDVNRFLDIIKNSEFRNNVIISSTKYLLGLVPVVQLLNKDIVGVSFGESGQIVLHNGIDMSKIVNINDILYMQILLDGNVVQEKGRRDAQSLVSSEVPCRKISLKFVMQNEIFAIDVMKENLMGTLIKREDSAYQNAIEFARKIADAILLNRN